VSQPPPSTAPPAPQVPTAPCSACGHAFDLRAEACTRCGFPRPKRGPGSPIKQQSTKTPRSAMWLSLFWPGGGHFYAGDPNTGAVLTVIAIVILALSTVLLGPEIGLVLWCGLALRAAIGSGRLVSESLDR
jgi:ribosomal protein L37E